MGSSALGGDQSFSQDIDDSTSCSNFCVSLLLRTCFPMGMRRHLCKLWISKKLFFFGNHSKK